MTGRIHLTAADVRQALRRRFPQPASAILFEVAAGVGAHAHRRLDAVVVDLWPSRGQFIHGIEIKVSRGDWRRELAEPEKAEELAQYCDMFSVAAPVGTIPPDEVPAGWGHLEVDEDGKVHSRKPPAVNNQKTKAVPIGFLAALLRSSQRGDADLVEVAIRREREAMCAQIEERIRQRAAEIAGRQNEEAACWRKLVESVGADPDAFFRNDELIGAVSIVHRAGISASWRGLKDLVEEVDRMHERLAGIASDLALDLAPHEPLHRRAKRKNP